jgi:hypothetical protein
VRVRLLPVLTVFVLAGCGVLGDEPKAPRVVTGEDLAVMVLVRSGSLIGSVTAVGRGNELNPRDVIALIPKLRARLRAAG